MQGQNVVVGNLVYSLALGMSVPDVSGAAIANLEVESLVHRSPTFHGDTIYAETKVVDKVASRSRDDRGVVTVETKAFNQRGRGGLLLPAQGDGVEAGRGPGAAPAVCRRRLGLTSDGPPRGPVAGRRRLAALGEAIAAIGPSAGPICRGG